MKEGRKKQARSNKQTNNKAKQHSTPKVVTFPKKNELPRVGPEPDMTTVIMRCPSTYYFSILHLIIDVAHVALILQDSYT